MSDLQETTYSDAKATRTGSRKGGGRGRPRKKVEPPVKKTLEQSVEVPEDKELLDGNTGFSIKYFINENDEKVFIGGAYKICPRCSARDTKVTHNISQMNGPDRAYVLQYRKCIRAVCNHSFKTLKPI